MDLRPSSARVRRRLIQSTLFPQDNASAPEGGQSDDDKDEDRNNEDDEYCGSQSKKKRPRKPKAVTKSRASIKLAVNGEETLSKGMDDKDSPVTSKSDFFLKISERRNQKRQQKEQLCVGSPEEFDKTCSPPDLEANMKSPRKQKRRASVTPNKQRMTTPKKRVMNNGLNEACYGQMLNNQIQSEHTSPLIPDLRLEAKMTAEENSRIFGGKQLHPFFSSWKTGRRNQESTDEERNWCSVDRKAKSITFNPIHVFEEIQEDDHSSLDWGKWVFSERLSESTSYGLESQGSSINEGLVKSLQFDNFLDISRPTGTFYQKDGFSDQCPIQLKEVSMHNYEMMSYCHGCRNQPENSLWTDKYQPEKAIEICGNGECVNFLNEWLRLWNDKGFRASKNSINGNISIVKDVDYYSCESDSEDIDEENRLKNVLLVTGPVGSGKSAAIYACAKEQGFQVIEVNTSDWRNGALVKQRFREAVESHWLQRAMESPEASDTKHFLKSSTASFNASSAQGSDDEVIELIPLSDEYSHYDRMATPSKSIPRESRTANNDQSCTKTLILFEDVDATLSEDHGFISTIQRLAETAKRPMILTTNSNDPVLPNNLDRLELRFTIPPLNELLRLVNMVCAAEKATIQPCLVERFIGFCQGDIRKTILHLQFWCQGQSNKQDREVQSAHGQVVFDPDTGHRILPKIISCGYPSQLSEIVEKEIAKSLLEAQETSSLTEIVVEEEELYYNHLTTHKNVPDAIEAKKKAMLRRHCSDQDGNELAAEFGNACYFSDSSGSPVAFSRRSVRKRTDTVLSSDSEEECLNDGNVLEVFSKSPSHCLPAEMLCNPLTKQLLHSQREKFMENCYPCSATADYSHVNSTSKSIDVSIVPESSFVPETELFSGAVSCGNADNTSETAFTSNDFPVNGIDLNISPSELHESPVCDMITESVRKEEEVANSHINNNAETAPTNNGFHVDGINLHISPSGLHEIPVLVRNSCDMITESLQEAVEDFHINSAEIAPTGNDFSVDGINLNLSPSALYEIPILLRGSCDTVTESIQEEEEEVADSNIGCVEAAPREYQGMDECSRMNFSMRSKPKNKPRSLVVSEFVQETWRKLQHCHMDLQQYAALEHKDASKVLKLAYGMSNLISEADLLLSDCQLLICDYLEPSRVPCEEPHSFSWHDDQLKMVSTISEHGMCLYAKDIAAVNSNVFSTSKVDMAWEMLASSTNTMALGKLVNQDQRRIQSLERGPHKGDMSSQSELASSGLCSIVQSIIPSISYLSIEGYAFHEYLSSMSQISRLEASRLSESHDKSNRRRVRVAQNYLSAGALSLSPEDISLLGQYNCYLKGSTRSMDASLS